MAHVRPPALIAVEPFVPSNDTFQINANHVNSSSFYVPETIAAIALTSGRTVETPCWASTWKMIGTVSSASHIWQAIPQLRNPFLVCNLIRIGFNGYRTHPNSRHLFLIHGKCAGARPSRTVGGLQAQASQVETCALTRPLSFRRNWNW